MGSRLALKAARVATDSRHDLLDVFRFFPGIAPGSTVRSGSDGGVELALAFDDSAHGKAAQLCVDFIIERIGAKQGGTRRLDAKQTDAFLRYLNYGSLRPMGEARPPAELSATPLPTLLSRVLHTFEQEYDELAPSNRTASHLGVWANVLRVIPKEGLDLRELGPRAILATRGVRVVVRDLQAQGWLDVERVANVRGLKMLRLTAAGQAAQAAGERLAAEVERRWRRRFRVATIEGLRAALGKIADAIDVELPYYLTGYGPGDGAITGGPYLPEEPGPPRIPARGEEWPVVLRHTKAAELPLFALFSIVLAHFAIDYERERLGDLRSASTVFQEIEDEGTPLEQVRYRGVRGSGRSTPERHLWVVVERKRGAMPLVFPSPKMRRARDSYPHLVMEIERNWQGRHGATVAALREGLVALDAKIDGDWPRFPNTMLWFKRLHDRNP